MTARLADGDRVAIVGAGPAGLTAGYELSRIAPETAVDIFEGGDIVGGISRTEEVDGFRFDIGGHRFYTKIAEVEAIWREILGDEFLRRPRQSRIFYRNRFYEYPLRILNALGNIGPYESARIIASYFKWQLRPRKVEDSFEDWVINRFGGRLYMHFFRSYTEKVWGIDPRDIRADWAAQRIKSMTLWSVAKKALTGRGNDVSLIEEFDYPRLGPGQMWERCAERLTERGQSLHMHAPVTAVRRDGDRIVALRVKEGEHARWVETDHLISTMALRDLVLAMDPPAPLPVREAAERLRYRDFLVVALILNCRDPFPDNWVYVHSEDVQVGRIQNFRAWSPDMIPNDTQACIGMEYFCNEGDALWQTEDEDLVRRAGSELERLGLGRAEDVEKGHVIRQKKAYPVYDGDYMEALEVVSDWLKGIENLQTVGRNGLHRYNNQDHSMLTALFAARNLAGASHDVWTVNVDRAYHEEMEVPKDASVAGAD